MVKKLQVLLNDEAWSIVEKLIQEANENFDGGTINYSDLLTEMVVTSKIDIKSLQLKHTNWRKSLKALALKDEADLESVIKTLTELKAKTTKRKPNSVNEEMPI